MEQKQNSSPTPAIVREDNLDSSELKEASLKSKISTIEALISSITAELEQDKCEIHEIKAQLNVVEQTNINDMRTCEMEYKDYISKFSQRVHTAKLSDISASKSYKEELITIKAMADKIHYDLNTEESKAKHIEDTIGNHS